MFFSIVVPVYNVEKYLKQCIESLIYQDFDDIEIILVDDGSTDLSGKLCDNYAKKDNRITVIHKENQGLLLARRTGLNAASGEYIIHCDSDDYYETGAFRKIHDAIIKSNCDMLLFGYEVVDDNGQVLERHCNVFKNGQYFKNCKHKICYELATTTWLNNMVTKVTKKSLVDTYNDYSKYQDIKMGEDLFQVIPLIRNCNNFIYIAEPFYKYRYNNAGISKKIKIEYIWNYLCITKRLEKLLIDQDKSSLNRMYERFQYDIYKYYLRFIKQGISKKEYCKVYCAINSTRLFEYSNKYAYKSMRNLILKIITLPPLFNIISQPIRWILKRKSF